MAVLDVCKYPLFSIYQPHSSVISAITQSNPAVITTLTNHDLINGTIIRLTISPDCGMEQINGMTPVVTVIDPVTLSIPINTIYFDAFVIPEDPLNPGFPPPQQQPCSFVVPIGEQNDMLTASVHNVLG